MKRTYRHDTPARVLADASGQSVEKICRRARIGAEHFERLARRGKAGDYAARRLALICNCHHDVFLYGLKKHRENRAKVASGAVGTAARQRCEVATSPAPRGLSAVSATAGKLPAARRRRRPDLHLV